MTNKPNKPKYERLPTTQFKKDLRRMARRGRNLSLLEAVVERLACGETLEPKYRDHALSGNRKGYRDCHIQPDWILIYKIEENILTLVLSETGSHSDLSL